MLQDHSAERRESQTQQTEAESLWTKLMCKSVFQFPFPQMEMRYQTFLASQVGGYSASLSLGIIFGFLSMIFRVFSGQQFSTFTAPPGLLPSVVLSFVPAIASALLIFLWPDVYARHWRAINFAWKSLKMCVLTHLQLLVLWTQFCTAADGCPPPGPAGSTSLRTVQAFLTENYFFTIIWFHAFAFFTGQASDLAFATLGLFLSLAQNAAICASPMWRPHLVSLAPPFLRIAESGSDWFFLLLSAHGFPSALVPPATLSCTAVRAFWQVLGWGFFAVMMLVRDVCSRRAFLRASTNPASDPQLAGMVKRWPFATVGIFQKLSCLTIALSVAPSVIWAIFLVLSHEL
jgi:hypothetical protein